MAATAAAPPSIRDEDLVTRAIEGDRWAEDALYRRFARPVLGVVIRLLGRRQDAEDVVHEAFLAALEQLPRLRDRSAFRSWLMRIAVVRVRRTLRRERLMRVLGLSPLADTATLEQLAAPSLDPEMRTELAVVDAILRRLPADQRIAWMLRFVEGYALEEIAELCGCSLATVKRRVSAAQQKMSAAITVKEPRGAR